MLQAQYLAGYIESIESVYEDEEIILAGHSAGGVVARAYLVQNQKSPVKALVSFFSPHLGTGAASIGMAAGNSPLGLFAPFMGGGTLNRSQSLYRDLVSEQPGSFLYWLNRQPHPFVSYVSVIRSDEKLMGGDLVVSAESQDMNNVLALRGRVRTIPTTGGHGLDRKDGDLLVQLLRPWMGVKQRLHR